MVLGGETRWLLFSFQLRGVMPLLSGGWKTFLSSLALWFHERWETRVSQTRSDRQQKVCWKTFTVYGIFNSSSGHWTGIFRIKKRKGKKTEYVVSCTEYCKERKKLVQVLLAICLVRCMNDEVRACICWWKECLKKDGVIISIFFEILEQGDQTWEPVPKCSSLRLSGGLSDCIPIASSIWRCNISWCWDNTSKVIDGWQSLSSASSGTGCWVR